MVFWHQRMSYVDHVTQWLNDQTCDGTVKRPRKVSRRQRVAANDRERRRMRQLNAAFDRLRQQIPAPAQTSAVNYRNQRPLSRIQTLRLAIDYIAFMINMLDRWVSILNPSLFTSSSSSSSCGRSRIHNHDKPHSSIHHQKNNWMAPEMFSSDINCGCLCRCCRSWGAYVTSTHILMSSNVISYVTEGRAMCSGRQERTLNNNMSS